MSKPVIRWSKRYHEDLGPQDESGSYAYAYRYFMYAFYAQNGSKITVRQYREEPAKGSLFIYSSGYEVGAKEAVTTEAKLIAAVVAFLKASEGLTQFDYFNAGYKSLNVPKPSGKRSEFSFVRVAAEA